MPHHHHRHVHVHDKRQQDVWDKVTSKVASALKDAFPTANKAVTQSTSYRTVYVTMTPSDWSGSVLSTVHPTAVSSVAPPVKQTPTSTSTTTTLELAEASTAPKTTPATTRATTLITSATPTTSNVSEITSVSADAVPTTLAVAPTTNTGFTTPHRQATNAATSAPTPTSDASKTQGTSSAAKAGIAIGILAGVLVVFLAIYFLFTKRRKQMEQEKRDMEEDEKRNGPFSDKHAIQAASSAPTTPATAPRLSLRPGSQFSPNLNTHPDRRASRGANIAMTAQNSRNLQGNQNNNPENPFGNHAACTYTPIPEEETRPVGPVSVNASEVGTAITTNSPPRNPAKIDAASNHTASAEAGAAAGVAVGLARQTSIQRQNPPKALDITRRASDHAKTPDGQGQTEGTGLTRKASLRQDNSTPQPLDLTMPRSLDTVPASPAGTEFSFNSVSPGHNPGPSGSAAAIAAAGGPPQSTVHRVQLDFKPTMEDEMELRAGQLVRLLHEYDDGWALCIRLDRSQQGVVPRTCLSTRPVKPRPPPGGQRPGPPVNPNRGPGPLNGPSQAGPYGGPQYQRPGSAQSRRNSPTNGQYPRPGSAQSGRPTPTGGYPMDRPRAASGAQGRPMSPAIGQRPQSPGLRYQPPRPQSPAGMNRAGPSPMKQQYTPTPQQGPVERKPVPGQAS